MRTAHRVAAASAWRQLAALVAVAIVLLVPAAESKGGRGELGQSKLMATVVLRNGAVVTTRVPVVTDK